MADLKGLSLTPAPASATDGRDWPTVALLESHSRQEKTHSAQHN